MRGAGRGDDVSRPPEPPVYESVWNQQVWALNDPRGERVPPLINWNVNRRERYCNGLLLPSLRKFLVGGGAGKEEALKIDAISARWEKSCRLNPDKAICSS